MAAIKLVIFDIAGTIIEDHGEVVRAFSSALAKSGIPFTEDEIKAWKGASKRKVIRHFAARNTPNEQLDTVVESAYEAFRAELSRLYSERLVPIPGAATTFDWCRTNDIQIATTTGFYREVSEQILERMGWRDLFSVNISSSDVREGRPAPYMIFRAMEQAGIINVREVINVGDTPLDLQAGTNAGVGTVVGVLTGAHTRADLKREPHTHILRSIAELPGLIERAS